MALMTVRNLNPGPTRQLLARLIAPALAGSYVNFLQKSQLGQISKLPAAIKGEILEMIRQLYPIAMLLVIISSRTIRADDEPKVDLRGPAPKVGQVFRTTAKFQLKDATVRVQGNEIGAKMSMTGISTQEVQILSVDGRNVTKFQTKHIQDELKTVTSIMGKETTEDEVDDLAGEIVLSQRRDNRWGHTLVDANSTVRLCC